jgi:hypothetical protein
MKNMIRLALSALSIVVLSACGGGTSSSTVSQTSTGFTVEGGLAQKGPLLKGSRVTISELNPLNYQPSGLSYDLLTKDNMGGFNSSGINFTRQHVQTFAQGYYLNEITGAQSSDTVLLQAQGDLTLDRLVNVNLLTTLAGPRTVALVTDKTNAYGLSTYRNFAKSRTQAQKEVLAAFRIYNGADMMSGDTSATTVTIPNNFSELDIAKDATPNKILVALSALVMQIGITDAGVSGSNGAAVSQFIANFQLDLVDDGLINGTAGSSALQASINTASAAVKLTTVATNLNTFYALPLNLNALTSNTTFTAAQLTPWVDSSGGTDLVVDKYKSSSTTAVVGTESKSATYTAGSDDAGTCFSVGSVTSVSGTTTTATTAATGALYVTTTGTTPTTTAYTAPVLVTKGQTVALGLTATAAGSYAGFIQRSAATSGACPTTTPSTGTTRLQKHSITASSDTTVTAPGTPTSVVATAGAAQISVAFTPSTSGGTATSFTATCAATGATSQTASGAGSPLVVTGLTSGTAYTCSVTATNTGGTSAASSSNASATPTAAATAPGAPTIGTVTAGNAQARVAFTAPSSTGGSAITGYTASCALGSATPAIKTGTASPLVVAGLTNGSLYSCTVTATNSAGTSVASEAKSVRPVDGVTVVPTKPTITSATAGAAQITVAFTAATSSTTATSYTATCGTKTATGTSSPLVVTGLTNGTAYTCTVTASNAGGVSTASDASSSTTPTATSTTVSYSTPANFASVIATAPATTLTPALASSVTNRGYYMISNASTASSTASYTTIGATYATTGYTIASGTLGTAPTYNDYLTKTMQLVAVVDGTDTYYRIDSYLHPNNSIDWGGSVSSSTLKFVNNFGKTSTTGNGYVTFAVFIDATTKVATLQAKNRYTYTVKAGTTDKGSTPYTGTYTKDSIFLGSGSYVNLASSAYSLSSTATSFYLYTTPLSLGVPSFMNPNSISFVTNSAAPFLTKVTTTSVEGAAGISSKVNSTYKSQVASVGTNAETKAAATTMLAAIKTAVESKGGKLRYSTDVYTAYRDAALATKLVSDSIADGTPGQNLVPYVYFTNEQDTSGNYHPFMVVVSYGNQSSPNGLKDVPHPPGSSGSDYKDATVTRYSNLENYIFMIPMKDYGQVTDVTTNVYPSTGTKNLWYDMFGTATTSTYISRNVYTWADAADNGILIDGSVMFPAYNNSVVPSHLAGELSASGCHVGQGGGGPHCHADGYQSGQGLTLYNDTDYVGKTHPPLLGFGYDGIALFGRYRTTTDSAMLGYNTLDDFGAHNHDSIGYHYHAHTVTSHSSTSVQGYTTVKDMYPLMKGAYIGVTSGIPFFRTGDSFTTNKYLGGTVN